MKAICIALVWTLATVFTCRAGETMTPATRAINTLGCDLLDRMGEGNALISPFSMQTALAMTYAGAAGATREEMARVLHYGEDEAALHKSLSALQTDLESIARNTAQQAERMAKHGGTGEPIVLTVANRLFGQRDYAFRPAFLELLADTYGAPFQPSDFVHNAAGETKIINAWVEEQTRERIRNLIPENALNRSTCLVLVNAIYMKAAWQQAFTARLTQPRPFQLAEGASVKVPTMFQKESMGYAKADGYTAVSLPYLGGELQFVVLLPDEGAQVAVTPDLLATLAGLPRREVQLYLPKFKIEPPLMKLSEELKALGMRSAFDDPAGSADFDRMAPRLPDDYLYISEIFHKTFLDLDEKGTEAAAATAVVMARATAMRPMGDPPPEVRVDRPFIFAVQHRASGACLFLGRVTDPR